MLITIETGMAGKCQLKPQDHINTLVMPIVSNKYIIQRDFQILILKQHCPRSIILYHLFNV